MGRLDGKVAIITGVGSGIGAATALRFASEGATVIATGRDEAKCAETVESCAAVGPTEFAALDVTDEDAWKELVEAVVADHGGLDILINNAGSYLIRPIAETTLDDWNAMMETNVTGIFLGIKHCSPAMAGRGASIVNVSSLMGMIGASGVIAYGASKGAVRAVTKGAAMELAPQRIRVNSVHPGFVNTTMAEYAADAFGTTVDGLNAMFPLGRIGEPADIADLLLFLASDESSWVTGAEHIIDGGSSAGVSGGAAE